MAKYLLQQNGHTRMTALTATIYDLIAGENSFRGEGVHQVLFCSEERLPHVKNIEEYTPVGSIEFIEKVLRRTAQVKLDSPKSLNTIDRINNYHIKPINVPTELQTAGFLQRGVLNDVPAENLAGCFGLLKQDRLFIKSTTRCKANNGLYDLTWLPVKEGKSFFVSEVIPDITSEWRVFVLNGDVVDMRRYMGSPFASAPPESFVKNAVTAWTRAPGAYTLDIGMTPTNIPFVIECHNFVSCGLYGCEDPRVLTMLRRGYQYELKSMLDSVQKQ